MKALAENIWVFDGEAVPFMTLPYTTRMTIVRLANNELWVHSPIKLTDTLSEQVTSLGTVKYLIAPNHLHHLFLDKWQAAYPDAVCYGTDEVIKKRKDLRFDTSLNQQHDWPWQPEIQQVMFTGSKLMEECVFFHAESGVLIVTDLIENFPESDFNPLQRLIAKGTGILAPNGKMPLDWRLSFMLGKSKARAHITKIQGWKPNTVVMAHGLIVYDNAEQFLKRSFSWLI